MKSKEIRKLWLNFFEQKGHLKLEPKSLVPVNDPSILWINSGVATLKDYFSGKTQPPSKRLTNSQPSIRTNDIENVGATSRHHTLFEMLGNFSIGDYFKTEAIEFGYEFIFEVLKFEKDKIYITYYSEDIVTYNKWLELGVEASHLIKGDRETNFWDLGSGPCGPDTEIFYDRGEKYDPDNMGIKLLENDDENDRYIEIWNIVFSEFNNDGENNYAPLAQQNIDTGAGLERIASILQDVPTNFDTDLFQIIISAIEDMTGSKYIISNYFDKEPKQKEINKYFKIIADHMRAATMAINDGAKPSNVGRGYVIRRLIRRAYRSIRKLGNNEKHILYKLVPSVKEALLIYDINIETVQNIIKKEEDIFSQTIKQGEEMLNLEIEKHGKIDEAFAFKMFETYGFPVELTSEILEQKNISLDMKKFNEYKKIHAEKSRGKSSIGMSSQINIIQKVEGHVSAFTGYDTTEGESKLIISGEENGKYYTLVEKTPFYATKGGQQWDKGSINGIDVIDVFNDKYHNHWHVTNEPIDGEVLTLLVDKIKREQSARNHSATHLLGKALSVVLGHSKQMGSENDYRRLRLDFPADKKLSPEQIEEVEKLVNGYIEESVDREYVITTYRKGIEMGALELEHVDYSGDEVRVVVFGEISKEFCGGTHVANTIDVEKFMITKHESKGSGTYRIEAIASSKTIDEYVQIEIKKLEERLSNQVNKNKKLHPKYLSPLKKIITNFKENSADFKEKASSLIDRIKKSIEIAKDDYRKLSKPKKVEIDISSIKPETTNGILTYKSMGENPGTIKQKAIALREAFPSAIIILEADNGLVAVASLKYDSAQHFKDNYPGAKGGGQKVFTMGKK